MPLVAAGLFSRSDDRVPRPPLSEVFLGLQKCGNNEGVIISTDSLLLTTSAVPKKIEQRGLFNVSLILTLLSGTFRLFCALRSMEAL
jgi:hypothetical protein